LFGFGCGDFDRPGTGGIDDSGSLLIVERIEPTYFDESTNQVDVIQVNCAPLGEEEDWEDYTDHYAVVSMTNRSLDNATHQTTSVVHLSFYTLRYIPVTTGTPPFDSTNVFPIADSVAIEGCEPGSASCPEVDFTVELVPVLEKALLRPYVESPLYPFQLQYNALYIFYGWNNFGKQVTVEASTNFYASGYDYCEGG
jgi:hypothetical protein